MNELTIELKTDGEISLYEQIYIYIREEIRRGNLKCGTKLPSTRVLCAHLQVSRSTVQMAYDQLLSEGYIESAACRGYFVADVEGLYNVKLSIEEMRFEAAKEKSCRFDFSPYGIDLNSFPFNNWRKITKNVLVDDNKELFSRGDAQGEEEFRKTISNYLYQSRGVVAKPQNIIVGAGNEYLLMLLNQLLTGEKTFAMENPTYRQTYRILQSLGEHVVTVSQDKNGMCVDSLTNSGANIAYVMPSHQFPLGIVMPMKRRMELLKWANGAKERYIIEDDYDSEFRYRGKPIPALCGFDKEQKVIYIGTFSKAIAPAIRMSYMLLPDELMRQYHERMGFYSCTVSRIDQIVVKDFMESGYYEKHLNKMRALYKNRHEVLMNELENFRQKFEITGENAGIHLLLKSKENVSESVLIEQAEQRGIKVYPLSAYDISGEKREYHTVILGYANLSENEIRQGIEELRKAWNIGEGTFPVI